MLNGNTINFLQLVVIRSSPGFCLRSKYTGYPVYEPSSESGYYPQAQNVARKDVNIGCNIRLSADRHRFRQAEAIDAFLGLSSFRVNLGKHEVVQAPQYPVASYDTDVVEITGYGNYLLDPQCPRKKEAGMPKGQRTTGVSQRSTRTPHITAS